jgi:hypothetical protein
MSPIALTDSELHEVRQAAQMVPYDLRQVFLERLALELHGKDLGGELGALGMPNPYSRAEWTELLLQFRPPRDGPAVSSRLRVCYGGGDRRRRRCATFSGASLTCGRRAPIEQPQAACPPRRRMLLWPPCGLPRTGAAWAGSAGTCVRASSTATTATVPACCRRVPQGVYSRSSARYELARAAALEDLRPAWTPPPVDDAAWEGHLRWMALRDVRRCREWLLPHGLCCKTLVETMSEP